ncbi:conserved oligomeric Golgi complex subunit 3 [Chironomus tepperi]|uniref:conserved oligomeric Golgi complex subunit 3 n=1 Tax=Chironomus tepperi TaxID=113505 RepID=UPI00391FB8DF
MDNIKVLHAKVKKWDDKEDPLAKLDDFQLSIINQIEEINSNSLKIKAENNVIEDTDDSKEIPVIESIPKFLVWFDKTEEIYDDRNDDVYHKYYRHLEDQTKQCDALLNEIDTSIAGLDKLITEYNFVNTKTSSLNDASENLIREQRHLSQTSDDIKARLKHFTQVEHLIQRLQNPTFSPSSTQFFEIISSIDDSMEYLNEHPTYKESATYLVKYRQCLLKAIQMIKSYVTHILLTATEQVLNPKAGSSVKEQLKITDKTSEAVFALYYGKFQASSLKVKKVINLVEKRFERNVEYENLLSELHQFYLSQRATIMSSGVDSAIKDLCAKHKGDHCALFRASCTFLVHICQDEYRLFYQFFSVQSAQLTSYMEGLCTILYDSVRPFIVHINHLETLAEICSILRVEMLDEHVAHNPEALEAFGQLIQQMLEDVQERLIFRAHLYLQSDILQYNPSAGDLAYPEKLEMMESIALSLQENQQPLKRADSRSSMLSITSTEVEQQFKSRTGNSPADLHGMWYPTVRRTLVCLSRLYRCVDRPIFQGLSQEALSYCIQSLATASLSITTNKSSIDGKLFEIKHLLILREQIAPFRVDFTMKETSLDFSKMKTAAYELLQKRKQLFALGTNNALLEFLLEGTPQVKEHLLDSRKDVDRQLKISCEQFIKDATKQLVGPIILFIENAQNLLKQAPSQQPASNMTLRQTPWASPQQISPFIQESIRNIKSKLSFIQRSMQLYLSNKDTEFILFRPIRNNIIGSFMRLEQLLVTNSYSKEDLIIVSLPTSDQVSVIISNASLVADSNQEVERKPSEGRKISTSSIDKKVSFDREVSIKEEESSTNSRNENETH